MPNYDKTDLTSTLNYIKSEYGLNPFKDGKIIAFLSDLAPSLKREKSLLKKLVDKGLMKEIAENASSDETTQRRIIFKSKSFLVDEECLQEDFAVSNIIILTKAFNYNASLPQKSQESKTNSVPDLKNDETVKCSVCGYDNSKNNKFCGSCGNVLLPEDSNPFQNFLDSLKSAIGLEMVFCPAGSFMMGSPENEFGGYDNEIQHKVILTKPFLIGKYPVTQNLYEAVMDNNPSNFKDEDNPVEYVSWDDAKAFCDKLNKKFVSQLPKGYRFDLPTEVQWEFACRAGMTTALNNGKDLTSLTGKCYNLDEVAWYYSNSGDKTHPVGQKKPNAWGIYDMHGNVWEWCRDWYDDYPKGNVIDHVGPRSGSFRVYRGGSWSGNAWFCRSARRSYINPDYRCNDLGFRLALVLIQ